MSVSGVQWCKSKRKIIIIINIATSLRMFLVPLRVLVFRYRCTITMLTNMIDQMKSRTQYVTHDEQEITIKLINCNIIINILPQPKCHQLCLNVCIMYMCICMYVCMSVLSANTRSPQSQENIKITDMKITIKHLNHAHFNWFISLY